MLFRSGSATRIDVGLHEPGEGGHSAKAAYVVKECDTAMQDAAERGRLAALEWIARRSRTAPPAYRVSFDLPGVRSGENVGGASGGLAFAVAVARAVRAAAGAGAGDGAGGVVGGAADGTDGATGGAAGGAGGVVAAAGELGSGLSGGPVRGVQGIEAKIEGALACLPAGSRLLYPRANDPEVSAGLREKLREKGIEAVAVESVDGALDRLFPSPAAESPVHPGKTGSRQGSPSPRSGAVTPGRLAVAGLIGVSAVAAAALLIAGYGWGDGLWPFAPDAKGGAVATAGPAGPAETDAGFETGAGVPPPAGHEDAGTEGGTGPDASPPGKHEDVGFETGAGADALPAGGHEDTTPGSAAGSRRTPADGIRNGNAGGTPAFPGSGTSPAGGTLAFPGRAAPAVSADVPPSASADAPSLETWEARPPSPSPRKRGSSRPHPAESQEWSSPETRASRPQDPPPATAGTFREEPDKGFD